MREEGAATVRLRGRRRMVLGRFILRMMCWRFSSRAGPSGMLTRTVGAMEESSVEVMMEEEEVEEEDVDEEEEDEEDEEDEDEEEEDEDEEVEEDEDDEANRSA